MLKKIADKFRVKRGFILLLFGVIIGVCLLASESGESKNIESSGGVENVDEYVNKTEERLEALIEDIKGVSDVNVLISLKSGSELIYASDSSKESEKHVVVSGDLVFVKENLPEIEGVAIVWRGGNDQVSKAKITELVCSVPGLYSTRVYVTE